MLEPQSLESRFSNEDSLSEMVSIFTEPSEETLLEVEKIRPLLDKLPEREADFIELYYFRRINQTTIAQIFGVSQPTVCYRLKRATSRVKFLLDLPDITQAQVEEKVTQFLSDPLDAQIMSLMFATTCQSEVAKRLGETQGKVRHRFIRAIQRMRLDDEMLPLARVFESISENLVILREVRRPSWDNRLTHAIY
jgi:DNA-directed RNA polymerase specialized sigma subunit